MAKDRMQSAALDNPARPQSEWTLQDVLAQPSTDPNDALADCEWAKKNAQLAQRLADVANTMRLSSPISASKKPAAFVLAAAASDTDQPLSVKTLALRAGYRNDSDAKRVAKQLCASAGPFVRTSAGLILQTTRRKAPAGISWHDLTDLQQDLLTGLSWEVIELAMRSKSYRGIKKLEVRRMLGGPTIARLAGVPYCPNVSILLADLVAKGILRRPSKRSMAAGRWPADAPFRPHPFLREADDPPLRRSELRHQLQEREAQRIALQVAFQATRRAMRANSAGSAL